MLPPVVDPSPVATRSRAGNDRQRLADIGPSAGLVLIGENQPVSAVIVHVGIDVEAANAVPLDPSSGLVGSDEQRPRLIGVEFAALGDSGAAAVLPERHQLDVSRQRVGERSEHPGSPLVGHRMPANGIGAITRRFDT